MNTAILLCSAILAADNSAQVQANVLYGTADENQQRADIELWISQAVAKTGSPIARPLTNWTALTGENQRIYTSKRGGCIIDGKAIVQDGKYKVVIDGCEGVPLDETVTLRPGERRVVNLSDNPGPNNFFVALEAPLSEKARKRAEAMKADAKTFRLELNYHGEQDKPFYRLVVSVPAVVRRRSSPFERIVQISEDAAKRIIDHLARDGFFDGAHSTGELEKLPEPCYLLTVRAGDLNLTEVLGWGLPMIERIDGLRDVLPAAGKKEMDFLLGRLSGLRKQWEADQPALEANVGRDDSRISFTKQDDETIIDVTSEFGIDNATIKRMTNEWPKSMILRMHLKGMESLKIGNGRETIKLEVSSTGKPRHLISLKVGESESALGKGFPHWTEVRVVGGEWKIPLKQGYFEVPLPVGLFKQNPEAITVKWVDFYRN